jgi:hypothetical protein
MLFCQVVACAISYKAEVVYRMGDGKLGLLRHDEIDIIWKDYDAPLRSQFLSLFHEYRLAYPLFDSHGASLQASIVPAMLPEVSELDLAHPAVINILSNPISCDSLSRNNPFMLNYHEI